MRIQHNITALNAHRNLTNNNSSVSKNLEKLSSGYRINRAGDDAAGLAISEKMRAQITGLETAQKNAEDGVSLVQTAEGALTEVHSMLNRMVELATQSANGTYSDSNRAEMQKEIDALRKEIDRISNTSNFNGTKLFQGGSATDADAVTVTPPAADTIAFTDGGGGNNATAVFDVAGVAFDKDGDVTVSLGGKSYAVSVTADMTDAEFATALADAINADKIDDAAGAGEFTAAVANDTEITLTSANQTAVADADLKTALGGTFEIKAKAAEGTESTQNTRAAGDTEAAYKKDDVFTYDFSKITTAPQDTETVEILGKTFTFKNTTAAAGDVEIDAGGDLDQTLANLADAINADADISKNFKAAFADGKLTLTAIADGAAGADVPADLAGTWAAGNVAVEVPAGDDGGEDAGGETTIKLHVGESSDDNNTIEVKIKAMSSKSLGIDALNIGTAEGAKAAIDVINTAIDSISSIRSDLGALQNRLEHTINNLGVQTENITAAESRIRDVDMAKEMMAYTKNNILVQASQAMLAQANQVPQGVLQLLQ